jgi:hypothetical protein
MTPSWSMDVRSSRVAQCSTSFPPSTLLQSLAGQLLLLLTRSASVVSLHDSAGRNVAPAKLVLDHRRVEAPRCKQDVAVKPEVGQL